MLKEAGKRLAFGAALLSLTLSALAIAGLFAQAGERLPLFRHIDASLVKFRAQKPDHVRFLLADDMPPFVFRNRNGALTGYAVAVAQALCRRARVRCSFVVRPFDRLREELLANRGDVIIAGLRPLPSAWERLDFTRPYYKAMGRFAVVRTARLEHADYESLAGRRIAAVKGSLHALWLQRNFGSARLMLLKDFRTAAQALKEGRADALFADWLQLAFWTLGAEAQGCCRLLPEAFADRMFAWNHLSMAVRARDRNLRDFLDHQLDRLQEDGELRILARQFLPLMPQVASKTEKTAASAGTSEVSPQPGKTSQ